MYEIVRTKHKPRWWTFLKTLYICFMAPFNCWVFLSNWLGRGNTVRTVQQYLAYYAREELIYVKIIKTRIDIIVVHKFSIYQMFFLPQRSYCSVKKFPFPLSNFNVWRSIKWIQRRNCFPKNRKTMNACMLATLKLNFNARCTMLSIGI